MYSVMVNEQRLALT